MRTCGTLSASQETIIYDLPVLYQGTTLVVPQVSGKCYFLAGAGMRAAKRSAQNKRFSRSLFQPVHIVLFLIILGLQPRCAWITPGRSISAFSRQSLPSNSSRRLANESGYQF